MAYFLCLQKGGNLISQDGSIRITIEVDGKQIDIAAKQLDQLEKAGTNTGKGLQDAEKALDGVSKSSDKAAKDANNAEKSIGDLGDSGTDASKKLTDTGSALEGVSDSSLDASKQTEGMSSALDGVSDSASGASQNLDQAGNEAEQISNQTTKASVSFKDLAISLGLVALATKAISVLKSSLDSAISRFDTLNTFPKVLEQIGFTADDAERATSGLSEGIDGLPTKLDDVAATTQRFAMITKDLDGAVDTTLALNNAFLASGSSSADAARGLEQYIQMFSKGEVDMQSWRSLQETMPVALNEVAEAFEYTGRSAQNDLYDALKDGIITFDEFNAKIIELSEKQGGFADLAKTNSLGLATSLQNLKTAVSRNVANMIQSFDNLTQEVTGKTIAENIDGLKVVINAAFKVIGNVIEGTAPIIIGFIDVIKILIPVLQALSPVLIGLVSAFAIHAVINAVTNAIKANTTAVAIATTAKNVYAIATNRLSLAMALAVVKTKLAGIALAAYNKIIGLAAAAQALMTSGMGLTSIAAIGLSGAIGILGKAIKVLLGPVGWATAALGLLVGATIAIVKWFKRGTEEGKRLTKETNELSDASKELADNIESNGRAHKNNQTNIEASAKANEELAKKIEDLTKKENKSKAEKEMLKAHVEQLNGSIDELNLAYGEEADALNMTSEQLKARIELMGEQEKANAAEERLAEIYEDQYKAGMKLEEVNRLQQEWNEKFETGEVKTREFKKAIEELDVQEQELEKTIADLGTQQQETELQFEESMENVTALTEQNIGEQIILYETLSDANKKIVDDLKSTWQGYLDDATNLFDKLSDESKISIQEMQENLEENQRVIGEWSDNIAKLAERGVDKGLLEKLREAGPASAGHVKELVNASDTELERLSETFAEGGQVATDALNKSLGLDKSGAIDAVEHLVVGMSKTMKQELESANFKEIGSALPEGLGDAITDGTPDVEKASTEMAKKTTDATKAEFGIQSPSKVYREMGVNNTEGMVLGITSGTSAVINSIRRLAMLSINQFNNMPRAFTSIGLNAMAGLNAGLNSGAGRVMATARSIASRVASTMQRALKIHSPSRVMEDDVGRWIPAGVAKGIEGNADLVYKALGDLSSSMIKPTTPEMALGVNRMGAFGSHSTQSISNTETKYNTVDMQGMFDGAIFNVRTDNDIKQIAKELNDYIKLSARRGGVVMP